MPIRTEVLRQYQGAAASCHLAVWSGVASRFASTLRGFMARTTDVTAELVLGVPGSPRLLELIRSTTCLSSAGWALVAPRWRRPKDFRARASSQVLIFCTSASTTGTLHALRQERLDPTLGQSTSLPDDRAAGCRGRSASWRLSFTVGRATSLRRSWILIKPV